MRITDGQQQPHSTVNLGLTEQEALDLIIALGDIVEAEPGWHVHISGESSAHEITIYREDDETAGF